MKIELERLREHPDLDELRIAARDLFSRIDFTDPRPARIAKRYRRGRATLLELGGWTDDTDAEHAAASRIIKRAFKDRQRIFAQQLGVITEVMEREQRVLGEVERLEIQNEARAEVARRQHGERPPLSSMLMGADDLEAMPEPRWLIDRVVPSGGLVFLVGPSGVGKSALLLSMALASASARKWLGRDTMAGRWLIVVGEGQGGTPKRVAAERAAWGGDDPAIEFLFMQLDLTDDAQADELAELVAANGYVGVAYDTLNRHAGDADENAATAMAHVIRNIERIAGPDATSVVVHHQGHNGKMRGSTALYASADVVLELTGEPGYLTLEAIKMKDAGGGRIGDYKLAPSPEHDSIHVEGLAPGQGILSGARAGRAEEALAVFMRAFGETGSTRAQYVRQLIDAMGVGESTAHNYVGDLIKSGRLEVTNLTRGSRLKLAPTLTTFAIPTTDKE